MASKFVAEKVSFTDLCKLLETVSNLKKPDKRREILKKFINFWRTCHADLHGKDKTEDSFYPAMRLILPSFDKERGAYGFKEHMLAKKLIDILGMDKNGKDALRLLHYQSPMHSKAIGDSVGDFASVASEILKYRISQTCTLTVDEVNRRLDTIAVANASKDKASLENEIEWLCRKVGPLELKWLIRILLKQMKIGMQETTVLDLFHPDASQLYDVSTSLLKVCTQLHSLDTKLETIQIQLFTPFRPMLANRSSPEKVPEIMGLKPFYIEIKYDGERVQLHKNGNQYKYYSRNGNEFTNSYGSGPTEGSFTPFIHNVFKTSVKNCIIDGEMVGWNPAAKCVATKGVHFDVKALKYGDDLHPCFVAFDCLLLNDEVLTLNSLEKRLDSLQHVFTEDEGRFMFAQRSIKNSSGDVVDALNDAIERREEGIVVKRMDSTYRLNTRTNEAGWLKIKPDYIDNVCDDLDLLIIGGYFGDGRRSNLMSHFLLGVSAKKVDQNNDDSNKYISLCKVGSGYSMKELYDLNVHLNAKCSLKRGRVPGWCELTVEKPDVFVDPKNSKILQIRAAEIILSKSFAVGYTLRFPRVEKIREDKSWYDVMTLDEFNTLRNESAGKLAQKLKASTDAEGPSPKKSRVGRHAIYRPVLGAQFKAADLKSVKKKFEILNGKELCVLSGNDEFDKQKLEIKIKEIGGKIVQHPGVETYCVISGKKNLRAKTIIDSKQTNVVKADWLIKCINEGKFVPWTPADMWYATDETEKIFAKDFDQFGDSFIQPTTVDNLKRIFDGIKDATLLSRDAIADVEFEYFPDYKFGLFRRCTFFVDDCLTVGDEKTQMPHCLDLVKRDIKLYGGQSTNDIEQCTHILMDSKNLLRLRHFNDVNRKRAAKLHIVGEKWISDCISKNRLLSEEAYQPIG